MISHYLANKIGQSLYQAAAFSVPGTIAVALCTAEVTAGMTGATIPEATYTGYARSSTTPSGGNFSGSNLQFKNAVQITVGATPTTAQTITHYAILDNATIGAGNLLEFDALPAPITISPGDDGAFVIPVNGLVFNKL